MIVYAHAGEEFLYILTPVVLIVVFRWLGRRHEEDDEQD